MRFLPAGYAGRTQNMTLLKNDPKATDSAYRNIHKDLFWLDPPDLARIHVEELYTVAKNALDKKFSEQIKYNFHACYAEMYIAATFIDRLNMDILHPSDKGADFYINSLNCWVEVVAATDGDSDNPNSLVDLQPGKVQSYPEEQVILRLSSAFFDKSKKLRSDIEKGLISPSQPIIICISGGGMKERLPIYPVGGYPQIFKSLLPIGDLVLWMNRASMEVRSHEFKYRQGVKKKTSSGEKLIETEFFLDEKYAHISAVVYSWADAGNPAPREKWGCDFFTVHNPLAKNKLPLNFIQCGKEYPITVSNDSFTIEPVIDHEES